MMETLLRFSLRLARRFRPREGWAPLLLALVALLCPPAALLALGDEAAGWGLVLLTILAAIAGLRLARSRLRGWTAAVLAGVLGAVLVVVVAGHLVPPPALIWRDLWRAVEWLAGGQQASPSVPGPFAASAGYVWQRLSDLGVRLWWWNQTVAGGGTADDPIVFFLATSVLAWALGCFATWQIYRRSSPLAGVVPSGVALTTIAFFGGGLAVFYLVVYLFCILWLVATWHLSTSQARWQREDTDYPGDLGLELVLTLSPALTLIVLVAAFFPVLGPRQVRDAFWQVMDRPWAAVERVSERLFGPLEYGGPAGPHGRRGTLPQAHLLGSGPELGQVEVLYVTTNDPVPPPPDADALPVGPAPPQRYWRSLTYDTYTGQGWINSPMEASTSPPDRPLQPDLPAGLDLFQQVERLVPEDTQVYAVNAPLRVDQTVETWWRAAGDLVQVTGPADRYAVVSRPPQPTVAELRQASPYVPPDLAARYLALPETVPREVRELAHRVAGEPGTRYDQARAIETYLRAYPYSLDLPDPPAGRDLVAYFLFDLQRGYCDYYASSMVVMARAVGIPARLATGYVQGTYDYEEHHWVVTGADGHAWVEVYFDSIGWVEFEPTAGRPALDRPGGGSTRPAVPSLPPRLGRWWQRVPWALVGLGVTTILAVAVVVWIWRPRQPHDRVPADLVRDRHTRLLRWGHRLDRPLHDGQTASEYGAALGQTLQARAQHARWRRVRRAGEQAPAEIEGLTDAFLRAQYRATPITRREGSQVRDLWARLRHHLAWLWLGRR
jgi:transglutaminase-like putative cysteine protease